MQTHSQRKFTSNVISNTTSTYTDIFIVFGGGVFFASLSFESKICIGIHVEKCVSNVCAQVIFNKIAFMPIEMMRKYNRITSL